MLDYLDICDRNYVVTGYRLETEASGRSSDLTLIIEKVQDDGSGLTSIIPIENITIDNELIGINKGVYDNLRMGGALRTYTTNT